MTKVETHWTERDIDSFLFRIVSDFTSHVEDLLESNRISRKELAARLDVTPARISQVLNDPGNLGLKQIVRYSRALGEKVAVITYSDNDSENVQGPIAADVFVTCWEEAGKPVDFFELNEQFASPQAFVIRPDRSSTLDRTENIQLNFDKTVGTPAYHTESAGLRNG